MNVSFSMRGGLNLNPANNHIKVKKYFWVFQHTHKIVHSSKIVGFSFFLFLLAFHMSLSKKIVVENVCEPDMNTHVAFYGFEAAADVIQICWEKWKCQRKHNAVDLADSEHVVSTQWSWHADSPENCHFRLHFKSSLNTFETIRFKDAIYTLLLKTDFFGFHFVEMH